MRKLELFDKLLAACEAALAASHDPQVERILTEAIAEAQRAYDQGETP